MKKLIFLIVFILLFVNQKIFSQVSPDKYYIKHNYETMDPIPKGTYVIDTITLTNWFSTDTYMLDTALIKMNAPSKVQYTILENFAPPSRIINTFGGSIKIIIKIDAIDTGYIQDSLYLKLSSFSTMIIQIPITIDVSNPIISSSKSYMDLGNVNINQTKEDIVYISNVGSTYLKIGGIGFVNGPPQFWIIDPPSANIPFDIQPGNSVQVKVGFSSPVTGVFNDTLVISNYSSNNKNLKIPITAAATIPAEINLDKTTVKFDSLGFLTTAIDSQITIKNLSPTENLIVSSIYIDGPLDSIFIVPLSNSFTIPPNGSRPLGVKFQPKETGIYSRSLHIINNSGNMPDAIVSLYGKVIGSTISVSPLVMNFGNIGLDASPVDTFITITNTGNYRLKYNIIDPADSSFKPVYTSVTKDIVLEPLQSMNMFGRFNPSIAGVHSDFMKIVNNSTNNPSITVNLSANVLLPNLTLSSTKIDFGQTSISTPQIVKSLTITNSGLSPITITQKILSPDTVTFKFVLNNSNLILAPGQTDNIQIEFHPLTSGSKIDTLKIFSTDPITANRNVVLSGIGGGKPVLSSSLTNINFGTLPVGEIKDTTIILKNDGNLDLFISGKSLIGTNGNNFSMIFGSTSLKLSPGNSDTIKVRYKPNLPVGTKTAQLQILNNDSLNKTFNVDLSGNAIAPILNKNFSVIIYDTTEVGSNRDSLLIIKNEGNSDLILNYISIEGASLSDFSIPSNIIAPITLLPGNELKINVQFKPAAAGVRFARLLIVCNDPVTPEVSIVIRGIGKITAKPNIVLSTTNLSFGYLEPTGFKDSSFVIKNSGGGILRIDSLNIVGPSLQSFSVLNKTVPFFINPSDSQMINVRCNGMLSSTKTPAASLRVVSNDLNNPISILSLFALLEKPSLTVSDSAFNFGNVSVSDTAIKEFTITNNSPVRIPINYIYFKITGDSSFSLPYLSFPVILEPSSYLKIQVKFSPKSADKYITDLWITSLIAKDSISKISISGSGLKPQISTGLSSINFGYVEINTFKDTTLILKNIGEAILKIESIVVSGADSSLFKILNQTTPIIINPAQSVNLTVRYSPVSTYLLANAKISIKNNDPGNRIVNVLLSGRGATPEISVSDTLIDFGKVTISDAALKKFKILNLSQVSLQITSLNFESNTDQVFKLQSVQFPLIIKPSDSFEIGILFNPALNKNYTGVLNILSNDPLKNPFKISLTGITIVPAMSFVSPLPFGKVGVNRSKTLRIMIENKGDGFLNIDAIKIFGSDSLEFSILSKPYPLRIESKAKDSIFVTFNPKKNGKKDAIIKINSNDLNNSGTINIEAEGITQNLAISKTSIDFGNVSVLRTKVDSVVIENQGSESILITHINLNGSNLSQFSFLDSIPKLPQTLNPGANKLLRLEFHPDSGGTKTASVYITSNDIINPMVSVSLTGFGLTPSLNVSFKDVNFGDLRVSAAKDTILSIKNSGKGILRIEKIDLQGIDTTDFKIQNFIPTTEINPDKILDLTIRFNPKNIGVKNANLLLFTNDLNNRQFTIPLNGKGVQPRITLSTNAMSFGKVFIIKTKDSILTVTNSGSGILYINKLYISGIDSARFVVLPVPVNFYLNPGDTKTITLQFYPVSKGLKNAKLVIESDDQSSQILNVNLSGEGIIPKIILDNDLVAEEKKDKIINFHLSEFYQPNLVRIFYKIGGKTTFDSINMTNTNLNNFNHLFNKDLITTNGLDFYIKFLWTGAESTLPDSNFKPNPLSLQINFQKYSNAYAFNAKRYGMYSVPVYFKNTTFLNEMIRNLGPANNANWRMFRWDGLDYQEIVSENDWQPTPGFGFWFISKDNRNIDLQNCYSVPTNEPFKIKLHPGWNQIGNPFLFPVSFSNLIIPSDKKVDRALWSWQDDEVYQMENSVIDIWKGYFIKNNEKDSIEILINPINYQYTISKNENNKTLDDNDFNLEISLKSKTNSGLIVNSVFPAILGYSINSSDEWDIYDISEPPPLPALTKTVSLFARFPHSEWKECKGNYIRDFRVSNKKGYVWNMEVVRSDFSQFSNCELIMEISKNLSSDYKIYLYPQDNLSAIFSQPPNGIQDGMLKYTFNFEEKKNIKNFRIIIGTKEFSENEILNQKQEINNYSLAQNYPNPFNPATKIEYTIPENSYVVLKIFNSLGQEIETLVNKHQPQGRYSIDWHANNLPSGIYYYYMHSGSFSEVKKMLYLR